MAKKEQITIKLSALRIEYLKSTYSMITKVESMLPLVILTDCDSEVLFPNIALKFTP